MRCRRRQRYSYPRIFWQVCPDALERGVFSAFLNENADYGKLALGALMDKVILKRIRLVGDRMLARAVEVELEELVVNAVYLDGASGVVVGLYRMSVVDDVELRGLVAEFEVFKLGLGCAGDVHWRLVFPL